MKHEKFSEFLHSRKDNSEHSDSEDDDEIGEFPGRKEIVTFLYWLTFCDKVPDGPSFMMSYIALYYRVLTMKCSLNM